MSLKLQHFEKGIATIFSLIQVYKNQNSQFFLQKNINFRNMSKQRPSGTTSKDGNNISSKLLGANLSDINIQKFRDLTHYQKQSYHVSGKLSIPILKTVSNKFSPEVIFTINLPNQAIGSIQCLSQCINLIVINLSRNSIDDLSPLKNITTLKIINFSENSIKSIQPLKNSKELTNIHLQGNVIKSAENLQPFKDCKQLRNLHLQSLSGNNQNPLCQLKNYRQNVFSIIQSLKRLDGIPKNTQFFNGSEIQVGKKKQLKIQIKSFGPFYTQKFPSVGQYQVPTFSGESGLKKSLTGCKSQIQDLQVRLRALLTQ